MSKVVTRRNAQLSNDDHSCLPNRGDMRKNNARGKPQPTTHGLTLSRQLRVSRTNCKQQTLNSQMWPNQLLTYAHPHLVRKVNECCRSCADLISRKRLCRNLRRAVYRATVDIGLINLQSSAQAKGQYTEYSMQDWNSSGAYGEMQGDDPYVHT